jgi:thiol-disulfide isomerase/thioredoxin
MKKILLSLCATLYSLLVFGQGTANISGILAVPDSTETLQLVVYAYGSFGPETFSSKYQETAYSGHFHLSLPIAGYPQYVDFVRPAHYNHSQFGLLLESGDDITITEVNRRFVCTGPGSAKLKLLYRLRGIHERWASRLKNNDPAFVVPNFQLRDSSAREQLACLDSAKTQLSAAAYSTIRADIVDEYLSKGWYLTHTVKKEDAGPFQKQLEGFRDDPWLMRIAERLAADTARYVHSRFPEEAVIERFRLDSCFRQRKDFKINDCYVYLKSKYTGGFRDALVAWLFYHYRNTNEAISGNIDDALSYMRAGVFRSLLQQLKSSRIAGAAAYDFSLADTDGKIVRFSDFKGKVVLLDFWYTGCPNCAAIAPDMAKVESRFNGKPVVFISICIDKKKETWLKSLLAKTYTSDHTVNLYTGGNGDADPLIAHYAIQGYPTLLLIGRDGKLAGGVTDPRKDNGSSLSESISAALAK